MSSYMTGTSYERDDADRVLATAMHPGDGHGATTLFGDGHVGSPATIEGDGYSISNDHDLS